MTENGMNNNHAFGNSNNKYLVQLSLTSKKQPFSHQSIESPGSYKQVIGLISKKLCGKL